MKKAVVLISMVSACIIFWTYLFGLSKHKVEIKESAYIVDQKIDFQGVVVSDIEERDFDFRFTVAREGINLIVQAQQKPDFLYGNMVSVSGVVASTSADYQNYLRSQNISAVIKKAKVTNVPNEKRQKPIMSALVDFRNYLINILNQRFPSPASELSAGILLGAKKSMPKNVLESFRKAGLSHIVVLSGFNISIIGTFIIFLLNPAPRTIAFWSAVFFIILFSVFVGGGATVVRSAIMAVLLLSTKFFNLKNNAGIFLLIAGISMSFWNPFTPIYDVSFQLSFLATLGVMYGGPFIQKFLKNEIVSTTIAATLATAPIIYKISGEIYFSGIISNVLVLPTMSLTMALSALTIPFSVFAPPAYLLLSFILFISKIVAGWGW